MNSNRDRILYAQPQEALAEFLSATLRYLPLLAALLSLGLLAVYSLSRSGLLGTPAWQVLAVSGISLAAGLLILPVRSLTARGRPYAAYALFAGVLALWSFSLVLLWQSAAPIAILLAWAAPLVAIVTRLPRRWVLGALAAGGICSLAVIWLDSNPLFERASTINQAALASLVLMGSTVLLFVIATTVLRLFSYRSVQSRLVTSFVLLLAVPVLITTGIAAVSAYTNSQEQFTNSLQAVSALKQGQLDSLVREVAVEMSPLEQGTGKGNNLLRVLYPGAINQQDYQLSLSAASTQLRDLIVQYPATDYEEVLLLDIHGNVILSTFKLDEGSNFAAQPFFQGGSSKFVAQMQRFPGKWNPANAFKLVAAGPLYGASSTDLRGVIVTVLNGDVILAATGQVTGLPGASVYLVNSDKELVTSQLAESTYASAGPVIQTVTGKLPGTAAFYLNHRDQEVLGYALWDPELNSGIVAEVPRTSVFNRALSSLLTSGLVGLFALIVAAIAALSTASSISEPIQRLAAVAGSLSGGDLTARASTGERDEVGRLAQSFNAMASQLEATIGNLEQRVAERTEALEQQTLRLRTAAEVARDSVSATGLDELLDQAARLIRDRFGFYHTGIFLLDEKREFAVLRASPSDAGKQMLANQHRLRVGEQGIVGRVSATGEPRIALDTGVDPVYFSNPLLPNTHSEMALPLKTADGTIGVIDIQSDQSEAFTQDDIAIVQVMADQLATAIQRTNLLQQVQDQLAQLEQSSQKFTAETWRSFGQSGRQILGYRFDNVRLQSVKTSPEGVSRRPGKDTPGVLHMPIRLRGQIIGFVDLRFQSERIPQATSELIQQIVDRLATALENARLLEDSMHRATKERAIGEITAKISASVNMRNVLQTAVEELGRAIPGSDVVIQFRPDAEI